MVFEPFWGLRVSDPKSPYGFSVIFIISLTREKVSFVCHKALDMRVNP